MYEELVQRLRRYHDNRKTRTIFSEAADAIEELSMRLHGDEAAIAGMKREIERMVRAEKPRWVSMPVRLPGPYVPVDKDCFNLSCPAYMAQCPCVACPNRTLSESTITSNRTMTQQEIRDAQAIVMGCKQEPPEEEA